MIGEVVSKLRQAGHLIPSGQDSTVYRAYTESRQSAVAAKLRGRRQRQQRQQRQRWTRARPRCARGPPRPAPHKPLFDDSPLAEDAAEDDEDDFDAEDDRDLTPAEDDREDGDELLREAVDEVEDEAGACQAGYRGAARGPDAGAARVGRAQELAERLRGTGPPALAEVDQARGLAARERDGARAEVAALRAKLEAAETRLTERGQQLHQQRQDGAELLRRAQRAEAELVRAARGGEPEGRRGRCGRFCPQSQRPAGTLGYKWASVAWRPEGCTRAARGSRLAVRGAAREARSPAGRPAHRGTRGLDPRGHPHPGQAPASPRPGSPPASAGPRQCTPWRWAPWPRATTPTRRRCASSVELQEQGGMDAPALARRFHLQRAASRPPTRRPSRWPRPRPISLTHGRSQTLCAACARPTMSGRIRRRRRDPRCCGAPRRPDPEARRPGPDRTQALRCLRESLMWASQAANGSITTGEVAPKGRPATPAPRRRGGAPTLGMGMPLGMGRKAPSWRAREAMSATTATTTARRGQRPSAGDLHPGHAHHALAAVAPLAESDRSRWRTAR